MHRFRQTRRIRRSIAVFAAAVLTAGLITPPAAAGPPQRRTAPAGPTATVAGSLQSELGCPADWRPDCAATDLVPTGDGYARTFALPAGSFEFKIAVDHSWDENYGLGGIRDGANIPLVLQAPALVTIGYDPADHLVRMTPAKPQPGLTAADRKLAGDSLRTDLTRERFYFVMTDRFANGDSANDTGGYSVPAGTQARLSTGFDPTDSGFYHGGDLRGLIGKLDYIKNLGTTAIWLTPSFKNNPVQGSGNDVSAG